MHPTTIRYYLGMAESNKFEIGQMVWFLKSMRMCRVVEAKPDGSYTVEVLDSGKRLFVPSSEGLMAIDQGNQKTDSSSR